MYLDFGEWLTKRRRIAVLERSEKSPDYTFDRWLKSVSDVGDQVDSLVGQAKKKEADIDREIDSSKKKKDPKPDQEEQDDGPNKPSGAVWEKLRKIANERTEEHKKKSSDSSKNSSK